MNPIKLTMAQRVERVVFLVAIFVIMLDVLVWRP
jgi:hypothetical protein